MGLAMVSMSSSVFSWWFWLVFLHFVDFCFLLFDFLHYFFVEDAGNEGRWRFWRALVSNYFIYSSILVFYTTCVLKCHVMRVDGGFVELWSVKLHLHLDFSFLHHLWVEVARNEGKCCFCGALKCQIDVTMCYLRHKRKAVHSKCPPTSRLYNAIHTSLTQKSNTRTSSSKENIKLENIKTWCHFERK